MTPLLPQACKGPSVPSFPQLLARMYVFMCQPCSAQPTLLHSLDGALWKESTSSKPCPLLSSAHRYQGLMHGRTKESGQRTDPHCPGQEQSRVPLFTAAQGPPGFFLTNSCISPSRRHTCPASLFPSASCSVNYGSRALLQERVLTLGTTSEEHLIPNLGLPNCKVGMDENSDTSYSQSWFGRVAERWFGISLVTMRGQKQQTEMGRQRASSYGQAQK